jgi:RimJ/RimL family protein N-acetyltransferase
MIERIDTDRLRLAPLTMEDVDRLVELDSDPEVMRFITGKPTSRAEVVDIVRASLHHRWIAHDTEHQFVGWFGLQPSGPGEAELGYRLTRQQWGRGYASEGSRAVIDRGFASQCFERIWAQTMAVNERSRHVMEACGMSYVRTFHLDWLEPLEGAEQGDVEYEIRLT